MKAEARGSGKRCLGNIEVAHLEMQSCGPSKCRGRWEWALRGRRRCHVDSASVTVLDGDRIAGSRQAKRSSTAMMVAFPSFPLSILCQWHISFGSGREQVPDGTGGSKTQGKEEHTKSREEKRKAGMRRRKGEVKGTN